MKKITVFIGMLLASSAFAADNTVIVTPGTGVTMKSKDVGLGVQAMQPILSDTSGNAIYGTAGSANANVLTVQGVASMTPFIVQGASATGAALSGNPVRIGLSDGTNAQNWLTALTLGDGVNGNNTGAVAPWVWNGATWDRMPGTAANGIKAIVTNAGTFATQATLAAETTKVIGTVNQGTSPWVDNISQINGVTPLMGNGVTGTGSQRVTIASDNTAFSVNATVSQATSSNLKGQVDPLTAASWGIGTATQNSTSATNGQLALAQFNTTPTTITTGNMSPLQMDSAGNLLVNIKAGAGSGGTAIADNAAFTQGSTNETPMGCYFLNGTYSPITAGHVGVVSCTNVGSVHTTVDNTNANGSATSASSSPVVIASDQAAVAIKAASASIASGAIASGAVASGAFASGSVASGAYASGSLASGAMVDLTNLSTPITPTTATATKSMLLGLQYNSTQATFTNGQQGSVQGSSRGALYVATGADTFHITCDSGCSGSGGTSSNYGSAFPSAGTAIGFTDGTNMVAGRVTTYGTAPTGFNALAVNAFVTNTNANGSTTSTNSSPVVIASDQAAVAIKAASASIASGAIASGAIASGAISSGAAVSGAFVAGSIADLAHGQGTMANSVPVALASNQSSIPITVASGGIASGAIASGALASGSIAAGAVSAGAYVSGSVLSGAYASGSLASGAVVDITAMSASTGAAPPTKAIYLGANASGATGGHLAGLISCDAHVFKHITSATDTLAVQGVASQTIRVCGWRARAAGVATWFLENTASANANCSSANTQITGVATEAANTGETVLSSFWTGLANTSGNGLCINSTGTGGVDIDIWYTQF